MGALDFEGATKRNKPNLEVIHNEILEEFDTNKGILPVFEHIRTIANIIHSY